MRVPGAGWLAAHPVRAAVIAAVIGLIVVIYVAIEVGTGEGFRNVTLVVAAIIAFPVLIWRTTIGVQQAAAADGSILNERFQTAGLWLGHSTLAVRTGGAQMFGVLVSDATEKYHVQVLRLLCAFVRYPPNDDELPKFEPGGNVRLREDVQAAIGVIGRRGDRQEIEHEAKYEPNLIDANLKGARLWGTYLARAICIRADLTEARLGSVSFDDANLESACFAGADLTGDGIDNPDAKGKPVSMRSAVLAGADFRGADLTGVDISAADFARKRGRSIPETGKFNRSDERLPARNLTQAQLDCTVAVLMTPPLLEDVKDSSTGEQLVWRGKHP